jgi:TPR repeat protein
MAQINLGVMYKNGKGVPQNHQKAVKWYRKAAEQGLAPAQFYLGASYHNGEGVPQNRQEAVKWYRKAAEQGIAEAQSMLKKLGVE